MNWGFAPSTKRGGWQMVWASSEYADVNARTFQCQEYDVLAELMLNVIQTSENAIKSYGVNVDRIGEVSKRMQEWVEQGGEKAVPNLTSNAVGDNFDIIARVDGMGDQDVFSGMTLLTRKKPYGVEVSNKLIKSRDKPCLEFHYWDSTEEYFGEFVMIQRL
jgi:hypothetical protein